MPLARYSARVLYTFVFALGIVGTFTIRPQMGAVAAGAAAFLALICYGQSMIAQTQTELVDYLTTQVEHWRERQAMAAASLLEQEREYDLIMRREGLL
jgi:hypothetical protein